MHLWLLRALLLSTLSWACQPLLAASGVPALPEEITFRTLDNGVRVVVKENHGADLVAAQVWVRVGGRYETAEVSGVSHVLEHMVFKGAADRDAEELKQEIEGYGGYVNGETTRDSTHYELLVASEFFEPTLMALARTLLNPRLSVEDLDAEREVIQGELSARIADPTAVCADLLHAAAFKEHPYGRPPGGTPASLRKISSEMLRQFHSSYYVGPNLSVVIVGNVKAEDAVAKVREAFGKAPKRQPPDCKPPKEAALTAPRKVSKVTPGLRQAVMTLGFHAPGINTPDDVLATDVLLTALGEGATSLLHERLRASSPPLVSAFQVDYLTQKDPGVFSVTCILPAGMMGPAQRAIMGAIEEIRDEPLTNKQLELADNVLEGIYTYQNEGATGQAASMGFYEAIDTYEFALTYIDAFRQVTPEQIQNVARRYFEPSTYVLAVVEPPRRGGGVEARNWFAPLRPEFALAREERQ